MPFAARLGDSHTCPTHVPMPPCISGLILPPCCVSVLIEGKPAARMGDICACVPPAPNIIIMGSSSVFIGGKPAARLGDSVAHGGLIFSGALTVNIGG